ncbi:glutaminase [Microbacterium sp. CFBP9034]|uniref:glutaminase n=1 Tax=Microbacterium sp. CFBP9034 TaxID=3096540 RepID=UPI002A6A1AAC|nr:glutaminase [Microbacterium sp. CFBP9034]MDY0910248.1 glutaminase [Microbacterium sp. CFBP9034]
MSTSALLDHARERLTGVPREGLGELVEPRRMLGIARAPRIVPRGTAWHLGALLLTDDAVLATGDIVRARAEARRGFTAESQRRRAELAAAARRGGFDEGATVHIGWRMLDPDAVERGEASGPLVLNDGVVAIRWSAAGGLMPLARYLDERVTLLLDPPGGA